LFVCLLVFSNNIFISLFSCKFVQENMFGQKLSRKKDYFH